MILLLAVVTLLLWRRCHNQESGSQIELTHQVREEDDLPDNSGSVADNLFVVSVGNHAAASIVPWKESACDSKNARGVLIELGSCLVQLWCSSFAGA